MKELLSEITIEFFFQFQPPFTKFQHNYKLILHYTTMFITFWTQAPIYNINLWSLLLSERKEIISSNWLYFRIRM